MLFLSFHAAETELGEYIYRYKLILITRKKEYTSFQNLMEYGPYVKQVQLIVFGYI